MIDLFDNNDNEINYNDINDNNNINKNKFINNIINDDINKCP